MSRVKLKNQKKPKYQEKTEYLLLILISCENDKSQTPKYTYILEAQTNGDNIGHRKYAVRGVLRGGDIFDFGGSLKVLRDQTGPQGQTFLYSNSWKKFLSRISQKKVFGKFDSRPL